MKKEKKLVIIGNSSFAEVAYECFTRDSIYEVIGFSVHSEYIKNEKLLGLTVFPFEEIEHQFNSLDVHFFVAIVYTQLNTLRTKFYNEAKAKGFAPASYISSRALVWPNAIIGEHCFIFENNTVQPFVKIGNNVIVWSGNHIGHHSLINDNCFISSHSVISGHCEIGRNGFIGINSTISNNIKVANNNWIGPNSLISKDTVDNSIYTTDNAILSKVSTLRFFKIENI